MAAGTRPYWFSVSHCLCPKQKCVLNKQWVVLVAFDRFLTFQFFPKTRPSPVSVARRIVRAKKHPYNTHRRRQYCDIEKNRSALLAPKSLAQTLSPVQLPVSPNGLLLTKPTSNTLLLLNRTYCPPTTFFCFAESRGLPAQRPQTHTAKSKQLPGPRI